MGQIREIQKKTKTIYQIDFYDPDGKRVRLNVGPYREAAERVLKKIEVDIIEGRYFDKHKKLERIKFEDFAELFFKNHVEVNNRLNTLKGQMIQLKTLKKFFGGKYLDEIRKLDILKFRAERLKTCKNGTVNRDTALIRVMFNKAIEWDKFAGINPTFRIKKLEEDERLRWLDTEEIDKLMTTINELPNIIVASSKFIGNKKKKYYRQHYRMLKHLVIFGLNTGLRWGEIRLIKKKPEDKSNFVDMKSQVVYLHKNLTKSKRSRYVPLNDKVLEVIQEIPKKHKSPYLFCNEQTGQPITTVKNAFRTACDKAGIEDFTFHDLRHTFASHLRKNGVSLSVIRDLLGHSTIKMTERYAHIRPDAYRHATDSLNLTAFAERLKTGSGDLVTDWSPQASLKDDSPKVINISSLVKRN